MEKKTGFVLLGLLQEEDLSGYEMKKIINERMSFFWQESYGQIYPQLKKLLSDECIIKVADDSKISKREKIKYRITEKGRVELKKWMESENEKNSTRSECLLKLFLSTDKNKKEIENHLKVFYEQNKSQLELFKIFQEQIKNSIDVHENHKQILSVLSLGIKQQELYCSWSKELINEYGGEI